MVFLLFLTKNLSYVLIPILGILFIIYFLFSKNRRLLYILRFSIILTAGCAKYRYNKLGLGDIDGIPRVIDAGQCNDSYSLVVIAQKLAEIIGVGINDLPIVYNIAWYEQKAVVILLSLLHLGIKGIRIGPSLPAFISPNILNFLVENFEIKPILTPDEDLKEILSR